MSDEISDAAKTEARTARAIQALTDGGRKAASDADVRAVLKWAHRVEVGAGLLEIFDMGLLSIEVVDGEPMFTLSRPGREVAAQIKASTS